MRRDRPANWSAVMRYDAIGEAKVAGLPVRLSELF